MAGEPQDPSVLPLAKTLTIEHSWAPRGRILDILQQAMNNKDTVIQVGEAILALTG